MFSRGNWSVFGIDIETLPAVTESFNNEPRMLAHSQLVAKSFTLITKNDSYGINPFERPRLDEDYNVNTEEAFHLADYHMAKKETLPTYDRTGFPEQLYFEYGSGFHLQENGQKLGFWFVINTYKEIDDKNSINEDRAYRNFIRPFKFLSTTDKRSMEADIKLHSAETTSKAQILLLRSFLETDLGAKTIPLCWKFEGDWIRPFLSKMYAESRYLTEFRERAVAIAKDGRFDDYESGEVERLVRNYFSTTELETELWVNLAAPAVIRLNTAANAVVAAKPATATTLLGTSEEANVYSAGIEFQERTAYTNKKGEERIFRKTLYTFDLSNGVNDTEAGVATLRGFDLPDFKKSVLREMKKSETVPTIAQFWLGWLDGLRQFIDHFTEAVISSLEYDRKEKYGVLPLYPDSGDDSVIEAKPTATTEDAQ
jgi:hypothetical protein